MAARSSSVSSKGEKGVEKGVSKGETCGHCGQVVKDGDRGMQCEVCGSWHHAKCENISEEGYKVLQMDNIHWYCNGCNKGVGQVLATLVKIQHNQDKLDKEVQELQANIKGTQASIKLIQDTTERELLKVKGEVEQHVHEIKGIKEAINEISTALEKQKDEQKNMGSDDNLWSTIVGKHVEKKLESVTGEMREVQQTIIEAKQQMDEEKDREKRKRNIIIYRAAESTAPGPDARKREDIEFSQMLIHNILEIECPDEEIESAIRLGKREENRCRPLLVCFKSLVAKNMVMESLGRLAEADEKFKTLSITHDMTQKERMECKLLVEEAKQRQIQESGEFIYRVRGYPGELKIVRLKKRQQAAGGPLQSGDGH